MRIPFPSAGLRFLRILVLFIRCFFMNSLFFVLFFFPFGGVLSLKHSCFRRIGKPAVGLTFFRLGRTAGNCDMSTCPRTRWSHPQHMGKEGSHQPHTTLPGEIKTTKPSPLQSIKRECCFMRGASQRPAAYLREHHPQGCRPYT